MFNALHGRGGEDGHVQAVLNLLRIPYTHSGLLASALAMDKPLAKDVFRAAGLPVPEGRIATRAEIVAGQVMPAPYVVKPTNEGSSVGVIIVRLGDNRPIAAHEVNDEMLVERFIEGRELTVAVMGDRPLGVIEIVAPRAPGTTTRPNTRPAARSTSSRRRSTQRFTNRPAPSLSRPTRRSAAAASAAPICATTTRRASRASSICSRSIPSRA